MHRNPANRKNKYQAFSVSTIEQRYLIACAQKAGLSISAFIRKVVLEGAGKKAPALPPEALAFRGQLLHLCGLLEPFSRKRLDGDDLNALERAEVKHIIQTIADIARHLKEHLQ
jgi:DNA-binding transcriptional MerR regulator